MNTLTCRVATVASTGALLLGGAVATASAATVGSGACTHQIKINTDVYTAVKFRTDPGTGYTATGQLSKGTDVLRCKDGGVAPESMGPPRFSLLDRCSVE